MEIKKVNSFVCVKDVYLNGDGEHLYKRGNIYVSEYGGCITNEQDNKEHVWERDELINQYFIPYSKLDRVYTKYTERLEKLFDDYEGKKYRTRTATDKILFFDNCDTSLQTGCLCATDMSEEYYNDENYTYLSEQAFIEFMVLGKYIGILNVESVEVLEESNDFKEITDSIAELLQYKNDKYGNSALEPLEIFGGKCKVGTRLDDKLSRIKNSESLKKNDVADLIGYCVLICKENNWKDFSEFMD